MSIIEDTRHHIEQHGAIYTRLADEIWNYAELGYDEYQSVGLHLEALNAAGFEVTAEAAGIPTALVAQAGHGGPVIAILGEYDALPGLSQERDLHHPQACSHNTNGNGHGCGHHLLGAAAQLAAVVVKNILQERGIAGTVRFYGCPAEEGGAGKTFMVRAGLFDDVDAALTWHPSPRNSVFSHSFTANKQVYFRFSGVSSHAAVSPHLGRSALDAVELMNVGVNYLREHMPPAARIHYAITDTGGHFPNVVQANAEVRYCVRAPHNEEVAELFERVSKVAEGAALMTGCTVETVFDKAVSNLVLNRTLSQVMDKHLQVIAQDLFDEADFEYARHMQENALSAQDIENYARLVGDRRLLEKPLHDRVMPYDPNREPSIPASSDVGDVSWVTPTAQCLVACYAFGTAGHTWQWVAQGKSSVAHKGMLAAAQTIAASALELFLNPELLVVAKQELHDRLGGKPYVCPIPDHVGFETTTFSAE